MAEQQNLGFWKFRMLMDKNIPEDVPWLCALLIQVPVHGKLYTVYHDLLNEWVPDQQL